VAPPSRANGLGLGARLRMTLDDALALMVRSVLRIFYRGIEIVGLERIPRGAPLLVVANHVNGLVDPLLIVGFLGLRPRILAKNTLWRHPVVAPLLVLGGALPVYRRQDGARVSRNVETFGRCRSALARGSVVLLFPEGTSHSEPHRLPLKTGAARIALEAEERHGPLGLRIVPVGLTYEAKGQFLSRVLVFVGDAIDPAPEVAAYGGDPRGAVKTLTERIAEELDAVTVSHASWREARLVDRAVGLVAGLRGFETSAASLAGRFTLRERVLRRHEELKKIDAASAARLAAAIVRFDSAVAAAGLDVSALEGPAEGGEGPPRWQRRLLWPLRLAGIVLNWPPYRLAGLLSDRFARSPDDPATYKILAAMLTFPAAWALEVVAAARLGGLACGLAAALLAPVGGVVALRFLGRPHPPRIEAHERILERLRAERDALRRELSGVNARLGGR
jgi:1-acyl-sn-glycerol-3-phosphate acyltransferase